MKKAGQLVLFHFPQTDFKNNKLWLALLLARLPGEYDDWLVCMVLQTNPYVYVLKARTSHFAVGKNLCRFKKLQLFMNNHHAP